jgi:hypothetical protein
MRPIARVLVVATGTVLFIAAGRNPEPPTDTRSGTARATVVGIQRVPQPPAADRAGRAAGAAVSRTTAREVQREAGDDERRDDDHDDERHDD